MQEYENPMVMGIERNRCKTKKEVIAVAVWAINRMPLLKRGQTFSISISIMKPRKKRGE